MNATPAEPGKIYEFTMKTIDGKDRSLADYKGNVLLVVNTASLCGFTGQYDGLEELHRRFSSQGLSILAFPANEFGAQEPGPDADIKEFCRTKFSLSFDLFSKICVKGSGIHPLYAFLTGQSGFNGDIPWNFTKFIVDRKGAVAGRYPPTTEPTSGKLVSRIESLLKQSP